MTYTVFMQTAQQVGSELVLTCQVQASTAHIWSSMLVTCNRNVTLYTASTVAASIYGSDGTLVSLMRSSNA